MFAAWWQRAQPRTRRSFSSVHGCVTLSSLFGLSELYSQALSYPALPASQACLENQMNEDRENAWHVGTAPHTAVIIMNLLVPEAWVPRLGGRRAGRR